MKEVNYFHDYGKIITTLRQSGAFLTVKDMADKINVMTIGWVMLGVMWRMPMLMVAVRSSRYTFQLLENADDFTVTFPFSGMSKELNFCGTNSGRGVDKIKTCNLLLSAAQKTKTPIIDISSARHYECRIVQATAMDKERLSSQYRHDLYQDDAYHTYYFGEILACYE